MANRSIGTMSESPDAGYLGIATDPTPNDHYSVSGVLAGMLIVIKAFRAIGPLR
jgi:hypothetical protein